MSSRHSHDEHGRSHIGTPGHKPDGYQAEPGTDAGTPMSERPDAFEQAIVRLSGAVTEAFNRGDVKTCAASYAEDAIMFLPDRAPIKGRDAIEAVLMEFSAAGMKLAPVEPIETRSSGDIGYCAGTYQFETDRQNERAAQENGKFVTVFMRQADGSWKAVLDSLIRDDGQ